MQRADSTRYGLQCEKKLVGLGLAELLQSAAVQYKYLTTHFILIHVLWQANFEKKYVAEEC